MSQKHNSGEWATGEQTSTEQEAGEKAGAIARPKCTSIKCHQRVLQVFFELEREDGDLQLVLKPSFQGESVRVHKLMHAVVPPCAGVTNSCFAGRT